MKIAIVTMTGENYGSALQAYALQQALRQRGAAVKTIRLISMHPIRHAAGKYCRAIRANPGNGVRRILSDIHNAQRNKFIRAFYQQKLDMLDTDALKKADQSYLPDVYLCGSDQIWNPQFQPSAQFYLDFCERDIPKYSYACSLAVDQIQPEAAAYYRDKLAKFQCLSVREATGMNILRQVLPEKTVRTDLDPVLLFDAAYWRQLASQKYAGGGYILLYMLRPSPALVRETAQFARSVGKRVLYLGDYYFQNDVVRFAGGDGVEDFLSAVLHADCVVTNSFHATAFSVLFEKNFCSVAIERTGSRVHDFLIAAGLADRITADGRVAGILSASPDFTEAGQFIRQKRADSLGYLNQIANPE